MHMLILLCWIHSASGLVTHPHHLVTHPHHQVTHPHHLVTHPHHLVTHPHHLVTFQRINNTAGLHYKEIDSKPVEYQPGYQLSHINSEKHPVVNTYSEQQIYSAYNTQQEPNTFIASQGAKSPSEESYMLSENEVGRVDTKMRKDKKRQPGAYQAGPGAYQAGPGAYQARPGGQHRDKDMLLDRLETGLSSPVPVARIGVQGLDVWPVVLAITSAVMAAILYA